MVHEYCQGKDCDDHFEGIIGAEPAVHFEYTRQHRAYVSQQHRLESVTYWTHT